MKVSCTYTSDVRGSSAWINPPVFAQPTLPDEGHNRDSLVCLVSDVPARDRGADIYP
jgi:hypothetical protein